MKNYFPSNPRFNKAALILGSMSPDIVNDIADLLATRGRSIISDLDFQDDSGPLKPYGIFSRQFINDEDFPAVFTGMSAIYLSQIRALKAGDNDFYETTLKKAFFIPDAMAASLAKKIETIDVIGGGDASNVSTMKKLSDKLQEGIRRAVNFVPGVFGINWENDQDQQYDVDFLYEVKQLGQVIFDLQSRASLMKGQAQIAASFGLMSGASGLYGDVMEAGGDAVDVHECAIGDACEAEMGFIPPLLLGSLGKLAKAGKKAYSTYLAGVAANKKTNENPDMTEATDRIINGQPGPVLQLKGLLKSKSDLSDAMDLIKRAQAGLGDVAHVRHGFGDAVADCWQAGDVEGAFENITNLAGNRIETTGDPELDEAVISEVLGEISGQYGDAEGALDSEFGGLFTRARTNARLRQAARRSRKASRQQMRQSKRNAKTARLIAAREAADAAGDMQADYQAKPVSYYANKYRSRPMTNQMDPETNPDFMSHGEGYQDEGPQNGGYYYQGQSVDGTGDDMFNMDMVEA